VSATYGWPRDVMSEPWLDEELLLRLFRLMSPAIARASAAREPRTEPVVLLADDDPDLIALIEATLQSDGITCRLANSGLAALRMAREVLPDLLMLDVRMPE
jgi:PleD family two-component response regulator